MRDELKTEQNCKILTPTLMAITAFPSRSPGLLNGGPGPHSNIFSPTDLNSNCNCSIGGMRVPSDGWLFSLPHLSSNWLELPVPGLYNNLTSTLLSASVTISHSIQLLHSQGYILIFLDWMHLLFTQVHFLFWRVGGQYTTIE